VKIRKSLLEETANYLVNIDNIDSKDALLQFEKGFRQIMGDTFSYYDTAKNHEYIYQSYILGLLAIIGDDYIIKSNRESGDGRYDIMLIPHDKTKYAVVIEIKQIASTMGHAPLNNEIKNALSQINKNKYYKELIDNKIEHNKIVKVPIVFVGKEPYVFPVNI
jgi:hypothetical protein